MGKTPASALTSGLTCEVCGRLPHPRKLRLTLAKLTTVFPIELLKHALVIHFHLSFALTVALAELSAAAPRISDYADYTHELLTLSEAPTPKACH